MPSGGARARSGPPADPRSGRSETAARRDGWTDLPAKHEGRLPSWPLEGALASEKKLWRLLWRKPQASMWARHGQEWQVAAYVRSFLEAAEPGAPASLRTAVLRMEDTLGLSTVGLNALRWRIPADEVAEARSSRVPEVGEERPAPSRRLRAVEEESA